MTEASPEVVPEVEVAAKVERKVTMGVERRRSMRWKRSETSGEEKMVIGSTTLNG